MPTPTVRPTALTLTPVSGHHSQPSLYVLRCPKAEPLAATVDVSHGHCPEVSMPRPVKIPADVPYMGPLIDLTAKITATEPEPATGQ